MACCSGAYVLLAYCAVHALAFDVEQAVASREKLRWEFQEFPRRFA